MMIRASISSQLRFLLSLERHVQNPNSKILNPRTILSVPMKLPNMPPPFTTWRSLELCPSSNFDSPRWYLTRGPCPRRVCLLIFYLSCAGKAQSHLPYAQMQGSLHPHRRIHQSSLLLRRCPKHRVSCALPSKKSCYLGTVVPRADIYRVFGHEFQEFHAAWNLLPIKDPDKMVHNFNFFVDSKTEPVQWAIDMGAVGNTRDRGWYYRN